MNVVQVYMMLPCVLLLPSWLTVGTDFELTVGNKMTIPKK